MSADSFNYDFSSRRMDGKNNRNIFITIFIIVAIVLIGVIVAWQMFFKGDSKKPADAGSDNNGNSAVNTDNVVNPTDKAVISEQRDENNLTSASRSAIKTILTNAQSDFANGDYVKISNNLEALLDKNIIKFASPLWREAAALLSKANTEIIFSDIPVENKRIKHEVSFGESFSSLASKYNTPIELIQRSNNLSTTVSTLRLGQLLYFYPANWGIIVVKSDALLLLYDGNKLFKVYNVGTGRQDRTPVGSFVISAKIKNPDWYSPDGKVYGYGEKENILGTRWMALKASGDTNPLLKGYGIHGTWVEGEITRPLSNGCIRMQNVDAEELFSIVPHKVPVIICDSFSPDLLEKLFPAKVVEDKVELPTEQKVPSTDKNEM